MARLQDDRFSKGLETVRALMMHPEFDASLGASIRAEGGAQRAVEAMKREFLPKDCSEPDMAVVLPELDASSLVRMLRVQTKERLEIDPIYDQWNFCAQARREIFSDRVDDRGRIFRVITKSPQRSFVPSATREMFYGVGAVGIVAAFVTWVAFAPLQNGLFICASNDAIKYVNDKGEQYVPFASLERGKGLLGIVPLTSMLMEEEDWTVVAFRQVNMGVVVMTK